MDGGAAQGGGGGSSTGGGAGCVPAPVFAAEDLDGKPGFDKGSSAQPAFNFANFGLDAGVPGLVDWMSNELFIDAPLIGHAIPALDYANCEVCLSISLGCDDLGNNCRREFLAQSGTISVDQATKYADAGTFSFHLENISYAEWDFPNDRAVPDGGCLRLTSFLYSGGWP